MSIRNFEQLLRPASVAVVGASANPRALGHVVLDTLRTRGFAGPIFPVNPRGGEIDGLRVFPRVADLPQTPDLAVIVTPPDAVAGVVADLGARGGKAAVVLTAGFGEGGHAVGEARRRALLDAARPHLFRIVGPNCLGLMVPGIGLDASFCRTPALPGRLALVAQSGAVASALLDWARPRGIGFSHVVTLGDMIDVDFGDMLDYLCADAQTHAILLYVEGITHPRKFMSAARRAARVKPVLAIKSGRSAASAKIAASHTGALAGVDSVYDAVFARAGIMRVDDLDDLFNVAKLLAMGAPVKGDRLAIVTNGGGLGVLAADRLLAEHGRLAALDDATRARLDAALPPTWSHGNPVDIIGDADARRYEDALAALQEGEGIDAVLALHCPTSASDPAGIAEAVAAKAAATPDLPVLAAWTGEESVGAARAVFARARIPSFATPRQAIDGFMQLVRFRRLQDMLLETPPVTPDIGAGAETAARGLLARFSAPAWLPPVAVRELLGLYGIPCNRAHFAARPAEAGDIARDWNCRTALKIVSPDIVHKSDVGGVVLDVDPAETETAAARLITAVRGRKPDARIAGVLVEEMVRRPDAHEIFLGMTNDATFGPVIVFGHGGTGVEVIDDKAFGLPPLNPTLARAMIGATRIGRLLAGYRNRPPADVDGIVRVLTGLSQMVSDHPCIVDLDINPLLADARGTVAVDARIKIDPEVRGSRMIIGTYPRALERSLPRAKGEPLFVRPLKPQDAPLLERFARRLSPQDIRFRFFAPLSGMDRQFMARLTQIDYDREMALIALPAPGADEILAVARFHADPDNIQAEFAVTVRSDLQGQGIGFALLGYLIDVAAARGVERISGAVLADNARMLTLAKALGMREDPTPDPALVRVVRDLRREE